ncbi:TPA_asm: hypothetical protein [Monosiga MELD virus 2]|nr:TPA_asm: hypothetical protein [Monosiga MELD virus 2]
MTTRIHIFGYDSTKQRFEEVQQTAHELHVRDSGLREVMDEIHETNSKKGEHGNLINNENLMELQYSDYLNVEEMRKGMLLYRDNNNTSTKKIDVEVSCNGIHFYKLMDILPSNQANEEGSQGVSYRHGAFPIDLDGLTHVRLINTNAETLTNVVCSLVGNW